MLEFYNQIPIIAIPNNHLKPTIHPCDACVIASEQKYKNHCKSIHSCNSRNIHFIKASKEDLNKNNYNVKELL